MKRILLLALILLSFSLDGCYCKWRGFGVEGDEVPVLDHWVVEPKVFDIKRCSKSDDVLCYACLSIEQKYVGPDSLKNLAARIDSIEFVVGNSVYKVANEKPDFERAVKYAESTGLEWFSMSLDFVEPYKWYNYNPFIPIPRSIKEVYMTVYVSFKFPEDGHIESKKVEMKLHEKTGVTWTPWEREGI